MPGRHPTLTVWIQRVLPDGALLLLISLAAKVYTSDLGHFLDLGLYDETSYLWNGLCLPTLGLPPAHGYPRGAPLYALWYWLLSLVQDDAVKLYYLNYRATTLIPSLALFLLLRASRVARTPAVCFSLCLLGSGAGFPLWPRISHLALAILLCGLAAARRLSTPASKVSLCAMAALLASYVRPELFLAFLSLWLLSGAACWWQSRGQHIGHPLRWFVACTIVNVALLMFVGVPFASMARSWLAFRQHYSLNAAEWTSSDIDPWTNTKRFVAQDFPSARSVMGALGENPRAFAKHVCSNVARLASIAFDMPLPYCPRTGAPRGALKISLVVLLFVALPYLRRGPIRRQLRLLLRLFRRARWSTAIAALVAAPPLLSIILIYPRSHYVLLLAIFPLHILSVCCRRLGATGRSGSVAMLVCVTALYLVSPISSRVAGARLPNLAVIKLLRGLGISSPVVVLSAEGEYSVYVGTNYSTVPHFRKDRGFKAFLEARPIDMVVSSPRLREDTRFRADPEWQAFLNEPSSLGFLTFPVEGVLDRTVLVRSHLLDDGDPAGAK